MGANGSDSRKLIELCGGYFFFYVITGLTVKYFLGSPAQGFPGMADMEYLVYSTLGGNLLCLGVVLYKGWFRISTPTRKVTILGVSLPYEVLYIIPSGICTAVVIPTTTLMYSLPISVMVAMVIMRGAIIIVSRIVDAVQIHQNILKKTVSWEENVAVVFALIAVGMKIFYAGGDGKAHFAFLSSEPALWILGSYIVAYAIRIYIMNYYKNTKPNHVSTDNRAFFGIEQMAAAATLFVVGLLVYHSPILFGWQATQIDHFRGAVLNAKPIWGLAVFSGLAYGMVAFFSVFIFMFKGRTATFAGLVNRLTSLVAGTAATLLSFWFLGSKFPKVDDWISLGFILIAVWFLYRAELNRKEKERTDEDPDRLRRSAYRPDTGSPTSARAVLTESLKDLPYTP